MPELPQTLDPAALPLSGLRLIEASAGTGKTYAIANLFLRLVMERGLAVERILVVTFTRAATEELRGRIRERLRQALAPGDAPDAFLEDLRARCGEPGRERLAAALGAMDEAAIHTIHGFCQRLLTDHALESGARFEVELVNEDRAYRLQAVRDFWRRHCYPLDPETAAWVAARWETPEDLLAALEEGFTHHGLRILPPARPDPRAVLAALLPLKARLAAAWPGTREALVRTLVEHPGLSHAQDAYRADRVQAAAEALDAYLAGPARLALPEGFELFTPARLEAALTRTAVKKGLAPPTHPLLALCGEIQALAGDLRRDLLVGLQAQALAFCRAEIRRRKAAADVLAPDDLLEQAHAALRGPGAERLAGGLRAAYPVALIDEFQDTDPLQYGIFRRIYAGAPDGALVLIGDPKQAIYGFRGADVFTYLGAARDLPRAGGRWSLDTNWRSADALVRGLNVLFGQGDPFLLGQEPAFRQVASAGRTDREPLVVAGDSPAPLHLWYVPTTPENQYRGSIPGTWFGPHIADACAAEIARLLLAGRTGQAHIGPRRLQARDLAVLVRDRNDAALVREALAARGVGSTFLSRDSVLASEQAPWLLWVLEAVLAEGEERALRRALAGPILGWDAAALERLTRDELALERAQLRFRDYAEHWRRWGFMPMFNRLLHGEGVPARLLAEPGGERALTDLRHLGELLQAAARERHGGGEGLLRWYRDQLTAGRVDSEDAQLRLESDEDLVQIVTVHKSKGLEYPVVFLPYPWRSRPVTARSDRLLFHGEDGVLTLDLGSERFAEHAVLAERERLAEDMRLLYVALTRVRHRVYCTWGNFKGAATSALAHLLHGGAGTEKLDDGRIAARLGELARAHPDCFALVSLPRDPQARLDAVPGEARGPWARTPRRVPADDWRVTSYSALVAGREELAGRPDYDAQPQPGSQEPEARAEVPASGVFAFPRGIRAGHCLHGILEEIDFQAPDAAELARSVRRHLQRQGLDPAWEGLVTGWMRDLLRTPLDPAQGLTLAAVPRSARVSEMGFHLPLSPLAAVRLQDLLERRRGAPVPALAFGRVQGLLGGFVDLVLEHRGRFYLVDYKSNHLGNQAADYGRERLEAAVREHLYDLQYLIYTVALHRYLGLRLRDYDYERHFGGVLYLFLRGMQPGSDATGVYRERPPGYMIRELDGLFRGEGA